MWVVSAQDLGPYLGTVWGWQDVQQVGWVHRQRQVHRGAPWTEEWVTIVTSLAPTAAAPIDVLRLVRQHWVIENRVHYVRDVTLGEDACQMHVGAAPQALAAVRNALISLLRHDGWQNIAAGLRHYSTSVTDALRLIGVPVPGL